MGSLNDDMKRVVFEQKLGFLATVCEDGTPNLSPKGTFLVLDDEHIMFGEMRSPGSVANLRARPAVEVNFVDPLSRRGYRFKGPARYLGNDEAVFQDLLPRFQAQWADLCDLFKGIVVIKVERALEITSPAYDLGATEDVLRKQWYGHFSKLNTERGAPNVDGAYALETPEDSVNLYRGWAATYDEDFAAANHYVCPAKVAAIYIREASAEDQPVLDVGCGTGLVGEALQGEQAWVLDGLDISPEMLDQARSKGHYRDLTEADLTRPLPQTAGSYGGLISVGTFTHGHVGPEALAELIRIGRESALYCIAINAEHFVEKGFQATLDDLQGQDLVTPVKLEEVRIYEGGGPAGHEDDTLKVAVFRKR